MRSEFIESFDKLDINTKRNQISTELLIMYELIKKYEASKNIAPITSVKNYNMITDANLKESEMLTFFYEDIYNLEQELISLLSIVSKSN